jgi:lipopolysaccharide export system protein LptA
MKRLLAAALVALVPSLGMAQFLGSGQDSGEGTPLKIEAERGIEWHQNEKAYVARGNALAARGDVSVRAEVLTAYYRQRSAAADTQSSNEIHRVVAQGTVRIATPTQTVFGDRAVYDIDQSVIVVTGKDLRLVTPTDTLTARDTLEWHDAKQQAVARGDAVAIRNDQRIKADVLVANVVRPQNEPSRISRVDAHGGVLVSTPTEIARGRSGVYNVDTGIVTLVGNVTITRGENEIKGERATVDLNKNVSRMEAAPGGRVEGLVMPSSQGKQ